MRFYTNNANIDFHVQNYVEGNVNSNRIAWFNASDNGFYSNYSIHAEVKILMKDLKLIYEK